MKLNQQQVIELFSSCKTPSELRLKIRDIILDIQEEQLESIKDFLVYDLQIEV